METSLFDKLIDAGPLGILAIVIFILVKPEIRNIFKGSSPEITTLTPTELESMIQSVREESQKEQQLLQLVLTEQRATNNHLNEIRLDLARGNR